MPNDVIFSLLDQVGAAVCLCDPTAEGCPTVFVNRAFTRLTGYEREDVVGKPCRYFHWVETGLTAAGRRGEAVAWLSPASMKVQSERKDGRTLRVELTMGPVTDTSGEIIYLIGTMIPLGEGAALIPAVVDAA